MKKNYFKKSLSLIMTVLMIMSCWVFVAPTEVEAAALEAASSLYNKSLLNGINTNVDYSVNTEGNYYKFKIYGTGDDGSANTTARQQKYYKNILSHDGGTSLVGDNNRGSYFSNVTNSELTVSIAYPTMVLKYDGVTTPKFGIMLEADASKNNKISFKRAWMDANSNGLSFNPNYWLGIAKDDSAFFYIMEESATKYLYAQDTSNGDQFSTRNNGQWEFLAASLEFTGSMSIGEWTRAISPTWKFSNGSTTYTGTNTSTIYVMNFKGYGELLTRINNHKTDLINNAGQYTTDSIKTYVDAAKAITNLNPKNYTGINDAASWGNQMNTAYNNYNNAIDGLKKREYEVTYDNMFSLADWRYSQSYEKSGVSVDLSAGKVTVKHPNSEGEYVTTHSGSSSNANTRNTNYYAMPVVGGQEYTFKYTTDGANTEMFAFFYDKNGGCAHESSFGAYCFTVNKGTGQKTFKAPDTATCVEIRFDNNTPSSTANYWDIMIYPAAVKTENEVDSWTSRPHRQLYAYNASVGTLQTPARPGYIFDGWKEDTDGDGVGDVAISGTVTKSRVVYSTWKPGTMDVGYDNLFSLSMWANSNSSVASNTNRGSIAYDLDAGTITAITTKDGEVYSNYGSAAGHYQMTVEPSTEYIFTADVDLEGSGNQGQMFVFFYKADGSGATGAIYNGASQSNPHIGLYVTNEGTNSIAFTTPADCTKMAIRVGATVVPTTATYSNIGFYEKADYDAYAKNYEKVREPFMIGETKNLMTPSRDGWQFDGWTLANGTKITSVAGLSANTTVYANWTKLWTVTFVDSEGNTIQTAVIKNNAKITDTNIPADPLKDSDSAGSYEFEKWTCNNAEVTADTIVTSDMTVEPTFKQNLHGNFIYNYVSGSKYPTCTEDAFIQKRCGNCGYSFGNVKYDGNDDDYKATGHNYTGNIEEIEGNADNHKVYCDNDCGEYELIKHNWAGSDPEGATCTTPGAIKWTCPCGAEKTTYGDTAPDAHNYDETKGTPNGDNETHTVACTYNAAHTKTVNCTDKNGDCACDICGQELIHVYDQKTETYLKTAADCLNDAVYYYTCKCGKQGTETWTKENSKLDHKYTNYVYNNDAKCGVDGTKTAECDTCDTGATKTITAEGTAREHEFTGAIKDNENGTHSYKCKYDDCDVYGGTVDCTYGEWDTTGADQHVKTCSACGYELKEDHDFSDWATTDESKQADGQHSKTCSVCDKVVTEDCTYTRTPYAETCTTDGYTKHSCEYCGHSYKTTDIGKTGHDYTGAVKSYNNGQHNFLCVNGCTTYGYEGTENARTTCTYKYENTAAGEHKATCTACAYSFTEKCSGGQASCTTLKVCDKCTTEYGETDPHFYNGTPVKLDGDKHAYLCEYCSTPGNYGVGEVAGATEDCAGGTATCTELAKCSVCKDTYGELAAHTFDGDAVALDGDVHAYRCSVCKNDALCGVGTTVNATEACLGGDATCTALAVCDICKDTHGELDADDHDWSDWANVEGTETHTRFCNYNNAHVETTSCESSGQAIVEADCEAEGYTLNTCDFCNHQWKTNIEAPLTHSWGAWKNNEDGTHTRTCEREGCHYADDHTAKTETASCTKENATYVVTAPDCINDGYTTYTCKDCGFSWVADETDATGHHFETEKKTATYKRSDKDCTTALTYWYKCKDCDVSAETVKDTAEDLTKLYFEAEAATGHSFTEKNSDSKYLAFEATCTESAKYFYSCENCGEKGTETFNFASALGHKWLDEGTDLYSAANCVNDAVYYQTCERCKISAKEDTTATGSTWTDVGSKAGHDFEGGYVAKKDATCTEDGVKEHYNCKTCGKNYADAEGTTEISNTVIKADGHKWVSVAYKAATCEEAGYSAHKECSVCGDKDSSYKAYDKLGHEYNVIYGYYTDTVNNYHAYGCKNGCGSYGVGDVKYTVEFDGLDYVITGGIPCEFTGEYVQYVDDNGVHSHKLVCACGNESSAVCADSNADYVAPVCEKDGYYVYICEACGYEWTVTNEGTALEHSYEGVAWTPNGNDTHIRYCAYDCGAYEVADCHTDKPVETVCGSKNTCDDCGGSFGAALDHSWQNKVDEKYFVSAANCDSPAIYKVSCANCGEAHDSKTFTDGKKLDHVMSDYLYTIEGWAYAPEGFDATQLVEPTCKEEGKSISYCANCDEYKLKTELIDESKHNYGEWITVGGDCGTGVTTKSTCKNCQKVIYETKTVPHTWKVVFVEEAIICGTTGTIGLECSVCNEDKVLKDDYKLYNEDGSLLIDYSSEDNYPNVIGPAEHTWSADIVIVKYPSYNTEGSGYRTCANCTATKDEVLEAYGNAPEDHKHPELGINDNSTLKYVAEVKATCTVGGHLGYYECTRCPYSQYMVDYDAFYVAPTGHTDNGKGECADCGKTLAGDNTDNCGCICHKESGFMKFIYKILRFFWKLFGTNKVCGCGNVH
jgi:uncharacterized repeat protein (TIGR02543 family)